MKTLIIAEKPSVAVDIARVLGGMKKDGDYYEGEQYLVGNALGHLLELVCPEEYEVKRGKWTFACLPVLPPVFDLKPISRNAEKLKNLSKLIRRKDVGEIINACDAGREGELIFRYIMQATKCKKPIKRLWLQSMTPAAIKKAFENLRTDEEMQPLAEAAKSRSEADWLVGINGTRAMTAFNSREGGFHLTTVGRVQTPTLAIVVRRENEIRAFKPEPYWEIHADFDANGNVYAGRWFDPKFKKNPANPTRKPERIFSADQAREIVARCSGKTADVTETSKRTTQSSPLLFDLTSLQREANNRFGFSAKTTLSLAQALYEKHKVLTYPRTDSRALPEDYGDTVRQTMAMLTASGAYAPFAGEILNRNWVRPDRRIFDNSKISDHFAIIPTLQAPSGSLSEAEYKVYDLVVKRFMAVFYPAAEFNVTTRISVIGEDHFKTEGKVLVNPGWMEIYGRASAGGDNMIAPLDGAKTAVAREVKAVEGITKPPARYSEATLLSAMEGAGKLVDDEALREAMSANGLGTPATRAAIIENLIEQSYMTRMAKELKPTAKADQLLTLINGLSISELSDPALTGNWECKLRQIENGQLSRAQFMDEIRAMTSRIVDSAKSYESTTVPMANPVRLAHRCPKCGGEIIESYRSYACATPGCGFSLSKHLCGRTFEVNELEELVGNGVVGPLEGFISKLGRPFSAALRMNEEHRVEFDFGNSEDKKIDEAELSKMERLCRCPKCGGEVLDGPASYFCANTVGKTCDFRVSKTILQQKIEKDQFVKLATAGRTDLLNDFVSNRSHRKFKAFLVWDAKEGKVGFEFMQQKKPEEGEAKAPARKTTRKTAAKKSS